MLAFVFSSVACTRGDTPLHPPHLHIFSLSSVTQLTERHLLFCPAATQLTIYEQLTFMVYELAGNSRSWTDTQGTNSFFRPLLLTIFHCQWRISTDAKDSHPPSSWTHLARTRMHTLMTAHNFTISSLHHWTMTSMIFLVPQFDTSIIINDHQCLVDDSLLPSSRSFRRTTITRRLACDSTLTAFSSSLRRTTTVRSSTSPLERLLFLVATHTQRLYRPLLLVVVPPNDYMARPEALVGVASPGQARLQILEPCSRYQLLEIRPQDQPHKIARTHAHKKTLAKGTSRTPIFTTARNFTPICYP